MSLVAGMCAGTDSIEDVNVLRTSGANWLFEAIYAPSTPDSFLGSFTRGQVRQLQAAARRFTANLIAHAGLIPPGEPIVNLDVDSKIKQVYGRAKQGASFGYTEVRGLHFQIVIATWLREGSASSGKGAASLVAEAIRAAREAGVTAMILVRAGRADSTFFSTNSSRMKFPR